MRQIENQICNLAKIIIIFKDFHSQQVSLPWHFCGHPKDSPPPTSFPSQNIHQHPFHLQFSTTITPYPPKSPMGLQKPTSLPSTRPNLDQPPTPKQSAESYPRPAVSPSTPLSPPFRRSPRRSSSSRSLTDSATPASWRCRSSVGPRSKASSNTPLKPSTP